MSHPSEAGHWYTPTGEPCYEVKARDGSMRPTTLRDAKKLGLYPSVTGIIRMAAAPGLEIWKQQQVLLSALTLPRKEGELDTDFCKRVMQDSQEQGRKAAERGTVIHAAIQRYYETGGMDTDSYKFVRGAEGIIKDWAGEPFFEPWIAEQSFAHETGFGGKVDLNGGYKVIDLKTKEFGPDDELKTWDEHAMQLAAYREGLGMPTARCAIVYVSVTHPGLARLLEVPDEDLRRGWECFKALLAYWQAKNKHAPNEALQGIGRKREPRAGARPAATLEERDPEAYRQSLIDAGRGHLVK